MLNGCVPALSAMDVSVRFVVMTHEKTPLWVKARETKCGKLRKWIVQTIGFMGADRLRTASIGPYGRKAVFPFGRVVVDQGLASAPCAKPLAISWDTWLSANE